MEGLDKVGPAFAGEDLVRAAGLALHTPTDPEERSENAARPRGRPVAQAAVAVSKDTVTGPGGHSPCSSRSARIRRSSAWAWVSASSGVAPYARQPGRSATSAIHRPSSSRSISTRKLMPGPYPPPHLV